MKNTRLLAAVALLLCLATGLQAAVTFVQAEQNAATGVTSVAVTFDSHVTAPHTLFVVGGACMTSGIANDLDLTDTLLDTYTEVKNGGAVSGLCGGFGSTLFYTSLTSSGANIITATNDAAMPITGDLDLIGMEMEGSMASVDQAPAAYACISSCTNTFNGPTVTIASPETIVATAYDKHSAHPWAVSSPWIICPPVGGNAKCVTNNPGGETLAMAYIPNAAAGTYTPQWTYTGSTSTGTVALTASFFLTGASAIRHKAVVY